ncbi:MAG: 3-deoxy-manno-octulosonate cytidylyltransferase [Deltaproteobacteria bacterium]|nr:3-deoxy-manno-octulosonate cytidylyltransferase [Deltaproteobacteria bacterium]
MSPAGSGGRVAVVIPSRYGATRLPGKPLAEIDGRPMIWYVWDKARRAKIPSRVVVATDDERIASVVRGFGGEAVMTSPDCASGTDRVAEAARGMDEGIFINLQGDEPLMDPSVIDAVAMPLVTDPDVLMSTAALPGDDPAEYARPSVVKVVTDAKGDALYFSRAPIPHYRETGAGRYRKHLGIYGYRREFLFRVAALSPSPLEEAERLEQLRVLQAGYRIRVVDVEYDSVGVDTPEDLKAVEERLCGPKRR